MLCSSVGLAVGECSTVMGLTRCMLCVQVYYVLCVLDYYLLNYQMWIQDWVGLCFGNLCVCWVLLRVWLPQLSTYIHYLNFQSQNNTFSKKLAQKYQNLLKWTADFILQILKAMTWPYCVSQCTSFSWYTIKLLITEISLHKGNMFSDVNAFGPYASEQIFPCMDLALG